MENRVAFEAVQGEPARVTVKLTIQIHKTLERVSKLVAAVLERLIGNGVRLPRIVARHGQSGPLFSRLLLTPLLTQRSRSRRDRWKWPTRNFPPQYRGDLTLEQFERSAVLRRG